MKTVHGLLPRIAQVLMRTCAVLVLTGAAPSSAAAPASAPPTDTARIFADAATALLHGQSGFPQEWRRTATLRFGEQTGTLICRKRGAESLCITKAGPFSEIVYKKGNHFYRHDLSGLSRELKGSLRGHERTLAMITDGTFLAHPEWAVYQPPTPPEVPPMQSGKTTLPTPDAGALDWIVFRPPGGERMRVGFDARHYPVEIQSPGDFGMQIIRLDDYRAIDGVMWPFMIHVENPNVPVTEITYTDFSGDAGNDAISAEYPRSLRARVLRPVTLTLEEHSDHLYAPVRIGTTTYRFLVDSGAQAIVIDPRIAATLPPGDGSVIGVRATDHTKSAKLLTMKTLSIGGIRLPAQPVLVADLGTVPDGSRKIDGILGFPFFAQAAVSLDLAQKQMTISPARSMRDAGKRCPLILDRGIPEIEAALRSGPRATFVLDTGSSDTVLVYAPFAKRAPGIMRPGTMREKTYGIGGSVAARDAQLEGVKICGMPWRNNVPSHLLVESKGAFANRRLAGSIGTAYFGDAVLGFDIQAGAFFVKSDIADP